MAQDTRMNSAASPSPPPSLQPRASRSPVSTSALQSGTFSADQYADRLMDELFEGVDRILEGVVPAELAEPLDTPGSALAVQTEAEATATPTMPLQAEMDEVSSLAIAPDTHIRTANEPDTLPFPGVSPEFIDQDEPQQPLSLFDRLLLLAAGISVIATIVLGFMLERAWRQAQNPPVPAISAAQLAEQNRQKAFLDYMQESLEAIDRRADQVQVAGVPPQSQMPTLSIPGSPTNSPTVLERVYIPVYQTPPIVPGSQSALSLSAGAPPASAVPAPSVPTAAAPAAAYTLVGVLDLGDRSAALVNINGTTQRFQVGETIGASGWTLVSIEDREAVIRRNGEVRSLFVGQVF